MAKKKVRARLSGSERRKIPNMFYSEEDLSSHPAPDIYKWINDPKSWPMETGSGLMSISPKRIDKIDFFKLLGDVKMAKRSGSKRRTIPNLLQR